MITVRIADQPSPIEDHTFRARTPGAASGIVRVGMCMWLGRCDRPQDDHITVPDFRARRGAR